MSHLLKIYTVTSKMNPSIYLLKYVSYVIKKSRWWGGLDRCCEWGGFKVWGGLNSEGGPQTPVRTQNVVLVYSLVVSWSVLFHMVH